MNSVSAPIAGMSHEEAQRSLLMQVQEIEKLKTEICCIDPSTEPINEVSSLVHSIIVSENNFMLTLDRIEETKEPTTK